MAFSISGNFVNKGGKPHQKFQAWQHQMDHPNHVRSWRQTKKQNFQALFEDHQKFRVRLATQLEEFTWKLPPFDKLNKFRPRHIRPRTSHAMAWWVTECSSYRNPPTINLHRIPKTEILSSHKHRSNPSKRKASRARSHHQNLNSKSSTPRRKH